MPKGKFIRKESSVYPMICDVIPHITKEQKIEIWKWFKVLDYRTKKWIREIANEDIQIILEE